jgi:SAM-dependent methyltransferase
MTPGERLATVRFPRSSTYHPEWVLAGASGGANPLWLAEWLAEALDLKPGMRILDLGCGRALSSIFLRREFDVQVWAVDLWFDPSENLQRARDAGVADGLFPIRADARGLPFAAEFFDVIASIDAFPYYGTDDLYISDLARFVRPGGTVAIAGSGLVHEIDGPVPEHLREWWTPDLRALHSAAWWRRHWERADILDIGTSDTLPDGWRFWSDWQRAVAPDNTAEIDALQVDQGRHLAYVRTVGRRRAGVHLPPPITSLPTHYVPTPLLRPK